MSRVLRASIAFDFDIDELEATFDRPFSDEEAREYVMETFIEDIALFTKYTELSDVVRIEEVKD